MRELVVLFLPGLVSDNLDDPGKHRNREDKRRKEEVKLSDDPDRNPATDNRELAISDLFGLSEKLSRKEHQ